MRNRVIKLILINHCYNIRPLFGFLLTFGIAPIIFGHCPPLDQQQCSGACFYEDKWEKVLVLKNWTEMEKKLVHRVFTIYPYLRTHLIIICPRESFEKLRHKTHKMKFFANIWHNFLVIINALHSHCEMVLVSRKHCTRECAPLSPNLIIARVASDLSEFLCASKSIIPETFTTILFAICGHPLTQPC